ncbi:MAG: TolC family protein, partial [Oxalobacteraceae bacterium]
MTVRYPIYALLLLAATRAGAQESPLNSAPILPQVQPVPAETDVPEPEVSSEPEVVLDELIRRAQTNNPQPQIAADNLAAARDRAAAAGSQFNPTLQIVPGLGGNANSRNEEVIVSQPLDLFGRRRANRRVSDAAVNRALAEQTLANRSLVVQVKNAAADLFAAQEAESLGVTQVSIARQFRDAAARKAQLGDVPPVQTQRAQLELDRAEVELDQVRAERLSRRATLNQIIGAPPQTPLRVALPDIGVVSFASFDGLDSSVTPLTTAALPGTLAPNSTVPPTSTVPSVSADANSPVSPV